MLQWSRLTRQAETVSGEAFDVQVPVGFNGAA